MCAEHLTAVVDYSEPIHGGAGAIAPAHGDELRVETVVGPPLYGATEIQEQLASAKVTFFRMYSDEIDLTRIC